MWKQYQKTLIPTQIVILVVCAFLYLTHRADELGTIIVFLAMEVASVLGAMWGTRLKRKIEATDKLPLE